MDQKGHRVLPDQVKRKSRPGGYEGRKEKTMNINRIENSTLAKLTAAEIGALDLCNYGVGLYRGELKTRYNGMKRTSSDGVTFSFEGTAKRIEFTEIVSEDEQRHWAARIWNKISEDYETYPMGIVGCGFFR